MNPADGTGVVGGEDSREGPTVPTRKVRPRLPLAEADSAFDRLRALAAHGYAADMGREGPDGGLLLHHGQGPDIVLHRDGTIEAVQRERRGRVTSLTGDAIPAEDDADRRRFQSFLSRLPADRPPRRWRKRFAVVLLLLAVWFFSIMLTIMIGNM